MPVVTDILEDHTGSIFRELLDCMTLKVEALCPSYISVTVYQWMWYDIPEYFESGSIFIFRWKMMGRRRIVFWFCQLNVS